MSFRSQIVSDIAVFLNAEEFAEEIFVDDIKIRAVIQQSSGEPSLPKPNVQKGTNPVLHSEIMFGGESIWLYFSTEEYLAKRGRLPQNGEFVKINGRRFKVLSFKDEVGAAFLNVTAERMPVPKMSKLPGLYGE